ncbi:hypothetical protein PFICI_09420 [Pestalotiopsis fici W106-1]|uniref:VWFA domain-containing protein n=1 Tax=Pestalotiopsis fici (strain W106-1 / CGMCC3.15140) TaxID=1229662 RepID=W3X2E6_PESFW|nr:uncharacterized protein PFICI_09420 [Pestalotiopsis fici W106-1]ETS79567.1 hypothetical protein PFICI_09420 [Pestalotiopsis fici W106-1]
MRRWFSTEILGRHGDEADHEAEKGTGPAAESSTSDNSEKVNATGTTSTLPQNVVNPFSGLPEKPVRQHKRNASASYESRWDRLKEFHVVFLIDDSPAMRNDWAEALSFLGEAIPECLDRTGQNVSVFFTNRWTAEPSRYGGDDCGGWKPQWPVPSGHIDIRYVTRAAAEAASSPPQTSAEFIFDGVLPVTEEERLSAVAAATAAAAADTLRETTSSTTTPATGMARRLGHILRPYVQAYTAGQAGDTEFKHIANLDVIVVTNGVDAADVQTETLAVAEDLAECGAPTAQVGLQFVQVGDSAEGGALLRELDSDIVLGERDMIDTVRYAQTRDPRTGRMTGDGLYKVLLGGVSRKVDMKKLENGQFLGKK